MNIIFSSQSFNLLITCGDILFGKYRVSWKCCLIKLVAYLHCGSVQVLGNKYLDTTTVKVSNKLYKTTLPADTIFTNEDVSTSDEQVERLTK